MATPSPRVLKSVRQSESPKEAISCLGTGLTVVGSLDADASIHVHGTVIGPIRAETFVLGKSGYVEGDIVARVVQIAGSVLGRVFAVNVTVDKTADVKGRIFHHTISIADGARIVGRTPWRPPSYFETLDQLPEDRP
jgi:cytoskeletal protein CcmA (bactofilin family)